MLDEKRSNSEEHRVISARGIIARVSILIIALVISSVAITSYETRTIEPQAEWEILVDSYDWEIDYWEDIAFYNATEGWIVGTGDVGTEYEDRGHGIVMHTSNGGVDWELMFSEKDLTIWQMEVVDQNTIWLATRQGLLHTENRGAVWEYSLGTASLYPATLKFRDSFYGLASISKGMKYTNDSGDSWHILDGWTFEESLYKINFVGDDVIWACGYNGIFRSSDGGTSWTHQRDTKTQAISVLNETDAWALSWDLGVTHSTDGLTWSQDVIVSEGSYQIDHYMDMEFIDEDNGWLVGTGDPAVAYTPDGGSNWYSQMASSPRSLRTMDFVNETHGWAAGWNGVIVRTENGNQFGPRLIKDGDAIGVMGIGTLRIPKSVGLVNNILLISLPVLFLVERVVFVIRRNRKMKVG